MKRLVHSTLVMCILALSAMTSRAEEGRGGYYLPGATASFFDAISGVPGGIAVLNFLTYYGAEANATRQLPIGESFVTLDVDATVFADSVTALYQARWDVLGGGVDSKFNTSGYASAHLGVTSPSFPNSTTTPTTRGAKG